MKSEIGWTMADTKRHREIQKARAFIRHNMAEAASLRNRAVIATRRGPDMILDAEMLEKRAQAMADEFNLGDARFA